MWLVNDFTDIGFAFPIIGSMHIDEVHDVIALTSEY